MAAFVSVQLDLLHSLLLLEHADDNLDEEELLLLVAGVEDDAKRRLLLPLQVIGGRVCLDDLTEEQVVSRFRFTKTQLEKLFVVLRFPDKMHGSCRVAWSGMEGLLVLLRRLSYPNKLRELAEEFGRSKAALSIIFNTTLIWFTRQWGHILENPFTRPYFTQARLETYTASVAAVVGVNLRVWGFIDGTVRPICRPSIGQQHFYNGHKRVHAVKFQAVVTPGGLFAHLHGPVEGRRHDASLFAESGLLALLQVHMRGPAGQPPYAVYGDAAYPLSPFLQKGFQGAALTAQQARYNGNFSIARMCVEWLFGEVVNLWGFVDFRKQQKILLQPVAVFHQAACLVNHMQERQQVLKGI